jgi:hypothetical protein
VDVSKRDAIVVSQTCGVQDPVSRWPRSGVSLYETFGASTLLKPHEASWGSSAVTSQGGLYRLCWCAGGDKLGSDQRNESALPGAELCKSGGLDISVDVGALHLQGVAPLVQDFTCVAARLASWIR